MLLHKGQVILKKKLYIKGYFRNDYQSSLLSTFIGIFCVTLRNSVHAPEQDNFSH